MIVSLASLSMLSIGANYWIIAFQFCISDAVRASEKSTAFIFRFPKFVYVLRHPRVLEMLLVHRNQRKGAKGRKREIASLPFEKHNLACGQQHTQPRADRLPLNVLRTEELGAKADKDTSLRSHREGQHKLQKMKLFTSIESESL